MIVSGGTATPDRQRIPFHVPTIGEEEIAEVVETLRSGWLTTGPRVRRFEEAFAARIGARHAVAVNSCTAALHLALEAVGVGAGDEVIIPTYTFAATGEVVTYLGARPVLADCGAGTFNVDATTVEPLLSPRTKAIIPVHVAGQACEMDPIRELAGRRGVAVVEDAAHALPATYRGRTVGTLGDLAAFSFYATKTLSTGEGGMVTTESDAHAARIRQMALHGLSRSAWERYADRGKWYYEIEEFGFKYNMTDIAAAIGIHQLDRIETLRARRQAIARRYTEGLGDLEWCEVPRERDGDTHAWHLYVLQLHLPALAVDRDRVVERLIEEGVGLSVHFIPLHLHPVYQRRLGYRTGAFPRAESTFERVMSLPIYPDMSDAAVDQVIESVRDVLWRCRR